MKPFDPGGAPHFFAGGKAVAYLYGRSPPSGESGSVQIYARRGFFCSRGLKEVNFLEDAEKRVWHCTHGATLYFTARSAAISGGQGSLVDDAHFASLPNSTGPFIYPRSKIKASDESIWFSETVAGNTEGQEAMPVEYLPRVHERIEKIVGCGNVQREELYVSRALILPVSRDEMGQATEFCIEDPEAPSTPDLQPEVRSWDFEALSSVGADQMLSADNFCPTGANDLVLEENSCDKDADDMFSAHKPLLKEENIMSICMDQCPAHKDFPAVSDLSYKCSSSSLCNNKESANSQKSSGKLNSRACRQYKAHWLLNCLMISAQSISAIPNNKKSNSQFLHTLRSLQRLIRLLKWEENLSTDIQIFLQVYTQRLITDQDPKAMEGSPAACDHQVPACQLTRIMVEKYSDRNGHLQNTKIIIQEEMLAMLWVFAQRYLDRRSGSNSQLRCLYPEPDNVGSCKLNQCSSRIRTELGKVPASDSPNLLGTGKERLSRSTELLNEMMQDFEEILAEAHGSSSGGLENGSIRIMDGADNRNNIPIRQVGESLETCRSHLQASLALNTDTIDGGWGHYLACSEDNQGESNSLPMPVGDGPCSPTSSQCSLSSDFGMEGLKCFVLRGEVHERHSRVKLEQYAEGFLLRRHIKQQQRRAQQAPPYPCRESVGLAGDANGSTSAALLAVGNSGPYACTKSSRNMNQEEPTMVLTSASTKPHNASPRSYNHNNVEGADVVVDIIGLVKYMESRSLQLETLTDVAVNSSFGFTHIPYTGGQLVIPNVNAVIVTIVAIMVYTKILLEGALSWVGSNRKHTVRRKNSRF